MCIEVELLISKGLPLPSVVSDMFYTIISLILASWLSDWLEGDQEVSCSAGSRAQQRRLELQSGALLGSQCFPTGMVTWVA